MIDGPKLPPTFSESGEKKPCRGRQKDRRRYSAPDSITYASHKKFFVRLVCSALSIYKTVFCKVSIQKKISFTISYEYFPHFSYLSTLMKTLF